MRYRFGQVAKAIGLQEQALRNWLARNEIDLFEAHPGKGWRYFSLNDVYVLSLAAALVRYKAPVNEAVNAAREALATMNFATFEGMPNYVYAAATPEGRWLARDNEGLVRDLTGDAAVVKVDLPVCLNAARKRLEAAESDANPSGGAGEGGNVTR